MPLACGHPRGPCVSADPCAAGVGEFSGAKLHWRIALCFALHEVPMETCGGGGTIGLAAIRSPQRRTWPQGLETVSRSTRGLPWQAIVESLWDCQRTAAFAQCLHPHLFHSTLYYLRPHRQLTPLLLQVPRRLLLQHPTKQAHAPPPQQPFHFFLHQLNPTLTHRPYHILREYVAPYDTIHCTVWGHLCFCFVETQEPPYALYFASVARPMLQSALQDSDVQCRSCRPPQV